MASATLKNACPCGMLSVSCAAYPSVRDPHRPLPTRSGMGASHEEQPMHRRYRLVGGVAGLVLLLGVGLSWGGPPNNDVSDAMGNTAGGTNALVSLTTGGTNTAFGFEAL